MQQPEAAHLWVTSLFSACSFNSSNAFDTRASHLISQVAVTNIKPTSLYMLPPLLSLLNQKEFAILAEGEEKEETQTDMDT